MNARIHRAIPIANAKNMKAAFEEYRLDGPINYHGLARALREAEGNGDGDAVRRVMVKVKALLEAPGIESLEGAYVNTYWGNIVVVYVNTGDMYSATLIYDVLATKFYVGDIASWREWREKDRDYKLGAPEY